MPPVKRFSVSFARHPTNGMSAFIQVYFIDTPPVFLHDLFCGKTFPVFSIFGGLTFGCVNYIKRLKDLKNKIKFKEFLFHHTPSVFVVPCVVFGPHL